MPTTVLTQINPSVEVDIISAPVAGPNFLTYQGGGGTIFGTSLKNDIIAGGGQYYEGNTPLLASEAPVYKVCNKVELIQQKVDVVAPSLTRGLYIFRQLVPSPSDINSKTIGKYYWDEVYTTPIGLQQVISSSSAPGQFSGLGNVITLRTNDINIVPKPGDYIVFQLANANQISNLSADITSPLPGSFTDGFSNMPVLYNTESYQLKITNVAFSSPAGVDTEYTITTDKSLRVTADDFYSIVLLNRQNTGLQKELFYDTFQQTEIWRDQLLGDSYFNSSSTAPLGRKNYLNYSSAIYLGMQNLLKNIINAQTQPFVQTPFLVYDISNEIQDRILPIVSTTDNINFNFHLPCIMIQEDTGNKLNILTNYGVVQTEVQGVGRYSGLYLQWGNLSGKRYGYVFYDLRIVVIDDSELALACGYNSNRNYTLPAPSFNSVGNGAVNLTSNLNLNVIGLQNNSSGGAVVVVVNGSHGLQTGTPVTIAGVTVSVPGTNQLQSASANGVRYIQRYYTDPINMLGELTDRFYIYQDSGLSTGIIGNGEFVNNGIGNSGLVKGAALAYNYFYTYRIKNDRYTSILPYSLVNSFNFSSGLNSSTVDNASGSLFINIPKLTYVNHADGGFELTDFELVIGKWVAGDPAQPFKITGIENVVVISVNELTTAFLPNNVSSVDLVIPYSIYNTFAGRIGNGLGAYDFTHNPTGDPNYDIVNNLLHYNITSGSLSPTLYTGNGQWTLGNITYQTQVEQYRSILQVVVGASEWNDTLNPSYDATNSFIKSKYISEIAITGTDSDTPLIYTKISPAIEKTPNLDVIISISLDF